MSLIAVRKLNLFLLIVYENILRTLIVIPARYKSKRFEGKPLALIRDKKGIKKTLIERTWDSAKKVKNIEKVIIATDDERIEKECNRFGANVVMTSPKCKNGTKFSFKDNKMKVGRNFCRYTSDGSYMCN